MAHRTLIRATVRRHGTLIFGRGRGREDGFFEDAKI
jgi:hypothetical protein